MARLKRQTMEGELVPIAEVDTILGRLAMILKGCQEVLQKAHGNDAAAIVSEALEDFHGVVQESVKKS